MSPAPLYRDRRGTLIRALTDGERAEHLRERDIHGTFEKSVRYAPCDPDGTIHTYGHAIGIPRACWPPAGATAIDPETICTRCGADLTSTDIEAGDGLCHDCERIQRFAEQSRGEA